MIVAPKMLAAGGKWNIWVFSWWSISTSDKTNKMNVQSSRILKMSKHKATSDAPVAFVMQQTHW